MLTSLWQLSTVTYGGRGRDNLRISLTSSNGWEYTQFRLSSRLQDDAGFVRGDCLDVLFDPDTGEGEVRRSKNGWKLQVVSGKNNRNAYLRISRRYCGCFDLYNLPLCLVATGEPGVVKFHLPANKSKKDIPLL